MRGFMFFALGAMAMLFFGAIACYGQEAWDAGQRRIVVTLVVLIVADGLYLLLT